MCFTSPTFGSTCQDKNSPISNNCIGCICEQVGGSGCDVYAGCRNVEHKYGPWCGPLDISFAYWQDTGNCTLDGDDPKKKECKFKSVKP